ncbi:MAG: hypothetical protein K9N00_05440 [Candidatus Marinimicrobia bacterium]|nr:hypothetical protein [Candidatus Neomarinimicrobiota bacterium]
MPPVKHRNIGFREIFFLIIALVLFGGIIIVDISFYHVPSFIKNFHTEREVVLGLSFAALLPFLSSVSRKFQQDYKKMFDISLGLLGGMVLLESGVQMLGGEVLKLWNNNPLLAENPDYWTLVSTIMTIFATSILIIILFNLRYLILARRGKNSDIFFKLAILVILAFALVLNFYEDHYSYKQLNNSIPIDDFSRYIWVVGGLALFTVNSFRNYWIEELTPREKIFILIVIIIILGITGYFIFSPLITKLYALSVTVKGFIIASFTFVGLYLLVVALKLLFHLPLIGYHAQIEDELQAVREISELISASHDEELVLKKVIKHINSITKADICWIESEIEDDEFDILSKNNISEERAHNISLIVRNLIKNSIKDFYYFDLVNNSIVDYIDNLPKKWKMLVAVPVDSGKNNTILYLISTKSSSFKARNINSLKTFLSFLKILQKNQA